MDPGNVSIESVKYALSKGYKHFDTAEYYHNESDLGIAIAESHVPRDQIFITSKVFQTKGGASSCIETFQKCLKNIRSDYIDQYLLHAPQGGRVLECYDALLELQKQGSLLTLGVSNFGVQHLEAIKATGRALPQVNQIELHPWCANEDIVKYCNENNIAIVGYSPLAKGQKLNDKHIIEIAKQHNKSAAQILIRWSLQKGFITIPKSIQPQHIEENANVFDFYLTESEMELLNSFGKGQKQVTGWDPTINPMSEFGPIS